MNDDSPAVVSSSTTGNTSWTDAAADTAELSALARSVFSDHLAERSEASPTGLWATLAELGLTLLTLPEAAGGSGGRLVDAAALLLAAGESSAPVPLAETDLLAGWLLQRAGLPVPAGPLSWAAGTEKLELIETRDGTWQLAGTLHRVGWARDAVRIAVVVTGSDGVDRVVSLDPAAAKVVPGTNVAGEPRDDLHLNLVVGTDAVALAPADARKLLGRRAALGRALLLAGAAGRALGRSVRYAGERVQFGRPIAKFQAIQQQLALAAAETAAGRAAVDAAVRIASETDFAGTAAEFAIAVAKARTSEAAGVVARIAHQVHGALGFTLEHDLRLSSTRLWAWRDEDGSEAYWHVVIGRTALAAGPGGLWPLLTLHSASGV